MSRRKQKLHDVVPKLQHVYAYFWPEIRPQSGLIVASLAALMVSVVFRLLEPWPLKIFLDYVLATGPPDASVLWGLRPHQLLGVVAGALVCIAICRSYADYLSRVGFFVVGNRVVLRVRDRVYRHLQDLPLAFHVRARTGDLIIRVTRDVSLLRDVTATAMLPLVASVAVLVGMVAVMLFLSWKLTLLALATLPLFWLTTVRLGRRIRESARRQRQREGAMATTAAESLGAIQIIKSAGLEAQFAEAFSQKNRSSQKEDLKASRLSVRLGRSVDVLLAISSALVIWVGGRMALQGQMSAGDIVVFLAYLKRSFKPAQDFAKYVARLAKAAAAGERVIEVLERRHLIRDAEDAEPAPVFTGHLSIRNLCFAFDPERPVLRNLSLEVPAGQVLAVVGPSGGGKSTLLGHILRLYDPTQGAVAIDGRDIREFTRKSLRRQTSSVMQDAILLADSVHNNISCVQPDATRDEVIQAARLAGAHDFIMQMPGDYEAVIGERGATLSRGQRQRIAVARAALRQAPILLLDEPTTGLDEENEKRVVRALLKLSRGRTTILVTHCLALASQSHRIAFLDAGRVMEEGSHDELLAKNGRYARWYRDQKTRRSRPRKQVVS